MTDRPCLARDSACYAHAGSVIRASLTNQALILFSSRTIPHPQLPSRPVAASGPSTSEVEVEDSIALVGHRTPSIRDLRATVSSRVSCRVARSIPRPLSSPTVLLTQSSKPVHTHAYTISLITQPHILESSLDHLHIHINHTYSKERYFSCSKIVPPLISFIFSLVHSLRPPLPAPEPRTPAPIIHHPPATRTRLCQN